MLAMLETTLSGMLCIFQGQELGLTNLSDEVSIEEYPDVETQNIYRTLKEARQLLARDGEKEVDMSDVAEQVRLKAREHGRQGHEDVLGRGSGPLGWLPGEWKPQQPPFEDLHSHGLWQC